MYGRGRFQYTLPASTTLSVSCDTRRNNTSGFGNGLVWKKLPMTGAKVNADMRLSEAATFVAQALVFVCAEPTSAISACCSVEFCPGGGARRNKARLVSER